MNDDEDEKTNTDDEVFPTIIIINIRFNLMMTENNVYSFIF